MMIKLKLEDYIPVNRAVKLLRVVRNVLSDTYEIPQYHRAEIVPVMVVSTQIHHCKKVQYSYREELDPFY